jgi:hypothetical protein
MELQIANYRKGQEDEEQDTEYRVAMLSNEAMEIRHWYVAEERPKVADPDAPCS